MLPGDGHRRIGDAEGSLPRDTRVWQRMIDHANTHLVYLDRDFNFVAVNQSYAETCQKKPGELIGKNHFDFFPHEENEAIFKRVRDTGQAVSFQDMPFEFPDQPDRGVTYWDWTLTPVFDANGQVEGLVFSLLETTEQKRKEDRLRDLSKVLDSVRRAQSLYISRGETREVFDTLLEQLVEMTASEFGFLDEVLRDPDGTPYKLNLAMSNISWDEKSRTLYDQLRARDLEFRDLENLAGLPALTGEPVLANDVAHDSRSRGIPHGHPPIHAFLGLPVRGGGELVGVIGVANRPGGYNEAMVTLMEPYVSTCAGIIQAIRSKAREREAEATIRRLEKSESLARMAGAIAHRFNNMLAITMINLEMEMVETGLMTLKEGKGKRMHAALDATKRAAETSQMMLSYLGQSTVRRTPLDLCQSGRECLNELQRAYPHIRLVGEWVHEGLAIRANKDQIRRVIKNLVENAIEAMEGAPGEVRLAFFAVSPLDMPTKDVRPLEFRLGRGFYGCLEVTDSGCGIAQEDFEKLFDPFYTTKFTGRGLGLPVVLGTVKSHEGCITVKSRTGVGTTVRVFFPLLHEVASPSEGPSAIHSEPIPAPPQKRLLLVEDEPLLRDSLTGMLTRLNLEVIPHASGEEALHWFSEHEQNLDAVICDLVLSGMDGWELIRELRDHRPELPVIVTSGYDLESTLQGRTTDRIQAFLFKPFDLQALKKALNKALGQDAV